MATEAKLIKDPISVADPTMGDRISLVTSLYLNRMFAEHVDVRIEDAIRHAAQEIINSPEVQERIQAEVIKRVVADVVGSMKSEY